MAQSDRAGNTFAERADRTLEPAIQRELEIREEWLMQECEHVLSLVGFWMLLRWDGD
ncbi:protein of unknown function (plasmid) [Escherichia coli]|nr:protein of unknown function [Escherichia coli]